MKQTTKKLTKENKEQAPAPDITADTIAFLKERIADGGATTGHLQGFLDKIDPPKQTEEEAA